MAKPVSSFAVTYRDYDKELSAVQVGIATVTGANFDATVTATNSLMSAISGVSLGRPAKHGLRAYDIVDSGLPAATKPAQRELKWLVRYTDTNGYPFQFTIPCADTSLLKTNSQEMELGSGNGATLKTQIEAVVVSPFDGSAVTVLSVELVGRST